MNSDARPVEESRLAEFDSYRSLLFSIAYRMLGSVADAEDILQEAFIRWSGAAAEEIRSPKAFLVTIVSRLCITELQSARVRREQYVGQWLPEPVVTDPSADPFGIVRVDESLSMALMVVLERLTPMERAVFLLHEIFGFRFAEIAQSLGQSEANCRQIFHRARGHVGTMRRRFDVPPQKHRQLVERFLDATRAGDVQRLLTLLREDVELYIDGGAAGTGIPNVVRGVAKVARGLTAGAQALPAATEMRGTLINGVPGIISYMNGEPYAALILETVEDRISAVYIVARSEKLKHLPSPDALS